MSGPATKPQLPQGTVTLLMTDVQSSASRWERAPEVMRGAIELHDRIAEWVFPEFQGVILKERGEGDSIFVVFEDPSKAVQAGAAFLKALDSASWPDEPIVVRVGIHTGDVVTRDRDYYGPSVNRCARIRALAHGGQILLSRSVEQQVQDRLPGTLRLRSLGQFRLKDLLHPEEIFQVVAPGLKQKFPIPEGLDAVANNLPIELTSYVGRLTEIQVGTDLVKTNRLVTLAGPGGSGKTRLALQIAAEVSGEFPAGVVFADLTQARPEAVEDLIARVVVEVRKPADPSLGPAESIADSKLLLVFDNCEHVIDRAAEVSSRLLKQCPNLRLMTTSRELLQVPGEVSLRVESLSVPTERDLDLESIMRSEAVQLFVERAIQRLPGFTLSERNAGDLAAICRELDGIPLAIEHAASQIVSMTPHDLRKRLSKRLALLRSRERGILPRHATLRATLDWSFTTLTANEQSLLPLLTVLPGGWDLEACVHVASSLGMDAPSAEDALEGLVSKSMVSMEGLTSTVPSQVRTVELRRFRLLETTREYAQEKLGAESSGAHRAAFDHFRLLASSARKSIGTADEPNWSYRVQLDMRNMLALLAWGISSGQSGVLEFASSLRDYWRRFGFVPEGAELLSAALAAEPEAEDELVARAWNMLGTLYWSQRRLDEARVAYERSQETYSAMRDELGMAGVLNNLALIAADRRDHGPALALMGGALGIYEARSDIPKVALVLVNMALQEIEMHEPAAALGHLERIDLESIEDLGLAAKVHKTKAFAYTQMGGGKPARRELVKAFELWQQMPDLTNLPGMLLSLTICGQDFLSSGERVQFLASADAMSKLSCTDYSDPETEMRDGLWWALRHEMTSREFQQHERKGNAMEPEALVRWSLDRLQA